MNTKPRNLFLALWLLTNLLPSILHAQGGAPLWTNRYDGPVDDTFKAPAIAVDSSGNVYVTGSSQQSGIYYDYATIAYSSAGALLWTNRYSGPGTNTDVASAVAVDSSGTVYVTGLSVGSGNRANFATIAYSSDGAPSWTNRYSGPGNFDDIANVVAVDTGGNVYVTGYSWGGNSYDYATIAYSSVGMPLWTNRYGTGNSYATALAAGSSGRIFVTGYSYSIGSGSYFDYATIAYSSDGVPLWTNRYNGPANSNDVANAVAVDSNDNVYVTGYSTGSDSYYDYTTVAYSSAGTPLWTNRYNGPANSNDVAHAIAVDSNGNVYVTGHSYGNGSLEDYATTAYSSDGTPLWTNRYNGPGNGNDQANAVAVDGSGNVYVTGYSMGNGSYFDYATIAYSSDGMPLWTNRYNHPNGNDRAYAMAVDRNGNVYVTGRSGDSIFGGYVTIKYSAATAHPSLWFQKVKNQIVLSWTNASFILQSAPTVSGTYTNVQSATSPYTNSITGPQRYFRLISD